jgi:hypothetical protein
MSLFLEAGSSETSVLIYQTILLVYHIPKIHNGKSQNNLNFLVSIHVF